MLHTTSRALKAWFSGILADRPLTMLLGLGVLFHLGSMLWGIPGADSWANDSVASRDHLAGVALNLQPGNHFRYPLFHLLVLALLSLPVVVIALLQTPVGIGDPGFQQAFIAQVVREPFMTWALVTGRLVTVLVSAVAMWALFAIVTRLWSRMAGLCALAALLTNAWFNYYSQTTNLDLPQLTWVLLAVWAAVEALFVDGAQSPRFRRFCGIFAALAVATKDQAAGVLLLGLPAVVLLGRFDRRVVKTNITADLKAWLPTVGVSAAVYVVASGALFNPTGYIARVKWLLGPASGEWIEYTRDLSGRLALLSDIGPKLVTEAHWAPIGWLGALGLVWLVVQGARAGTWLSMLPIVLAGSMTALFNLGALRTSPRFLLVQSVMLSIAAGVLLADVHKMREEAGDPGHAGQTQPLGKLVIAAWLVLLVGGLLWSARVNYAFVSDPRHDATAWLQQHAPERTRLEVYAKNFALLRIPPHLDATRVRQTPLHKRNPIAGLTEAQAPFEGIGARKPQLIALVDKHYGTWLEGGRGANRLRSKVTTERLADDAAIAHFKALIDNKPPYCTLFDAGPRQMGPLPPMYIHASVTPRVLIVSNGPFTTTGGTVVGDCHARRAE